MTKLLFAELRPNEGTVHELADGATIGREHCDVILDDGEVSRTHATVRLSGGSATIEDAGSRNGTFVNDKRIEGPAQLRVGDIVRIGGVEWRYDGLPGGAEQTVIGAPAADRTVIAQKAPASEEPEKTVIARKAPSAPEPVAEAPDLIPAVATPSAAHGDVPEPPDPSVSAVRPAIVPITDAAPNFGGGASPPAGGASAARRTEVTTIALAILAIDAVLLILYFLEVFG